MTTRKVNVLVTGTPGTGKTSLSSILSKQTGFSHIEIGKFVKDNNLHDGWDADLSCYILNEDKVRIRFVSAKSFAISPTFRPCPRRLTRLTGCLALFVVVRALALNSGPAQVCDFLEDCMTQGGNIVDHHGCDFFPER